MPARSLAAALVVAACGRGAGAPDADVDAPACSFVPPADAANGAGASDAAAGTGPIVLYDFDDGAGVTVADTSGVLPALDLTIADVAAASWGAGALTIAAPTILTSPAPPDRLRDALVASGELSIEAWVTPVDAVQEGPARIVTLSTSSAVRAWTLGQDGSRVVVRLRTTASDTNGQPQLVSAFCDLGPQLAYLVYTRARDGAAGLYIDGRIAIAGSVPGDFSSWTSGDRLALANELTGSRAWRGTYDRVAIFDRALSPAEVTERYRSGP